MTKEGGLKCDNGYLPNSHGFPCRNIIACNKESVTARDLLFRRLKNKVVVRWTVLSGAAMITEEILIFGLHSLKMKQPSKVKKNLLLRATTKIPLTMKNF